MIKIDGGWTTQKRCLGASAGLFDQDLVRGLHQGQRSRTPRKQAGQMTAPRTDQQKLNSIFEQTGRAHSSCRTLDTLPDTRAIRWQMPATRRAPVRLIQPGDTHTPQSQRSPGHPDRAGSAHHPVRRCKVHDGVAPQQPGRGR